MLAPWAFRVPNATDGDGLRLLFAEEVADPVVELVPPVIFEFVVEVLRVLVRCCSRAVGVRAVGVRDPPTGVATANGIFTIEGLFA